MFGKRIQYLQGQDLKISAKSPGICSSQTPCQLQCESDNKQQKVYQKKKEKCQRGRELSQYNKTLTMLLSLNFIVAKAPQCTPPN